MIAIPVVTLVLLYMSYRRANQRHFGIVSLLIGTFVVMGFSGVALEFVPLLQGRAPIQFAPMAYMSLAFVVVFWGFAGFRDRALTAIRIESVSAYRAFEIVLIVGGIVAMLFFLPFALTAMKGDIAINRVNDAVTEQRLAAYGLVNTVLSLMANLFIVAQIGFFFNLAAIDGRRRTIRAYLLLFSSLSFVVYVLAHAGRDGVVYWLMSYLFCHVLLRDYVRKTELKKTARIFLLLVVFLLVPFWMISVSRFATATGGTALWIINYAGSQLRNFGTHFGVQFPLQHGKFNFPVLYDVLTLSHNDRASAIDPATFNSYFIDQGVVPWVFTTFIGSFLLDFGKVGTLVFLFAMSLTTRWVLRKPSASGTLDFSDLLLLVVLYQTAYWGVFYFRLYVANYYIIAMILICVWFKTFGSRRSSVRLSKVDAEPAALTVAVTDGRG